MTQQDAAAQPDVGNGNLGDEIKQTTCYMCACRCGINVHLKDGKVRYIDGNRNHPINKGVLCAKGSAGIMQQYSPARLRSPLKRVGPRGSNQFEEISWEEALGTATGWMDKIRKTDPRKLAFFTGRDQSQGLTGFWAQQFGTPNYAAHGGFCSVNMAAGGIYTMGGAFWEFGTPDWDRTKLLMIFGVAEDHDSNPIKIGLSKLKNRGVPVVSVNPVRTGYSAVADDWVGITPGMDGLFIQALIHELLARRSVDLDYLYRYTNAAWLTVDAPGEAGHGLFVRDDNGDALKWDTAAGKAVPAKTKLARPHLSGRVEVAPGKFARPAFELLVEQYMVPENAPEAVADQIGISADRIRGLAAEIARIAFEEEIVIDQPWTDWTGEKHEKMVGRPVSMHAMRGVSAHSNGFQTCRLIHTLQLLLGSVDVPGGFRFKAPYPKAPWAHPKPGGKTVAPETPISGPPLGYPLEPSDLLVDDNGNPTRIDKAYSWEAPLSAHGMMHMVISNAHAGDPYPIDTLFMFMANMSWNSSMNTSDVMHMLTDKDVATGEYKIPRIIYSDAYASEMVAYADLILPDTTYLERHDCISLLDRPISEADGICDSIRHPVVEPDRDVRGFQSVVIDLGARLGLPGFVDGDGNALYKDYADYIINHQRRPGVGPLAGFRGDDGTQSGRGEPNPNQLEAYIANGGFWQEEMPEEARFYKPFNAAYQAWAVEMGLYDKPGHYQFQIYCETQQKFRLAAEGHGDHQPPDHLRQRLKDSFSPVAKWYPTFEGELLDDGAFPLHAITQRPAAMYHSWGSQNAWLRQIHGYNPLFVPSEVAEKAGIEDGGWATLSSHHASITVPVKIMQGVNSRTCWTWNAIGKKKGAWQLSADAPESTKGFLLNHLIHELLPPRGDGLRWANSDPVTGQAAWYDLRVKIERADAPAESQPNFPVMSGPTGVPDAPDELRFGQEWTK